MSLRAFPLVCLLTLSLVSIDQSLAKAGHLPSGVSAGDVSTSSAVLWTRSDTSGSVTFEVAHDAGFQSIVASQSLVVGDPAAPVKWQATGLSANRQYYYRAIAPGTGGETAAGSFRTAAKLGQKTHLKFGVSGDWRGELAPYPGISNAATSNLDFFVKLGDIIYADVPSPALNQPQAQTLAEFRAKQAEVYSARNGLNAWRDLQATTAIYSTIDDHEVTNDFAGGALAASDPRFAFEASGAEQFINQTPLYKNGLQAFVEYNAILDTTYHTPGNARFDGAPDLYRMQSFGNQGAIFMLDNRSFRDAELPDPDLTNPASIGSFLANSLQNGTRTMLGDVQVDRLKSDLLDAQESGVTWKFVMTAEPIQNLGPAAAGDRFEGYAYERSKLLKFIEDNQIENVVFVAADVHGTVINNLTFQDPENPASILGPQIATGAFEITTGAVAYADPFGPTVISLAEAAGLIGPAQIPPPFNSLGFPTYRAFYDWLGANGQAAIQETIIQGILNAQLSSVPSPYDPVGLDDNLAIADGRIEATLLQGGWTATTTYGWTEFDIDPRTGRLLVTTWGIPYYDAANLSADLDALLNLKPEIVSQFAVNPQGSTGVPEPGALTIFGTGLLFLVGTTLRRRAGSPTALRRRDGVYPQQHSAQDHPELKSLADRR